ncbi:hypothetical protein DPMN_101445 [Dreissena polymorpha]|uniref:Uncharacterized protein n=1 Tax=Dreissena polymorpha TaxID=45954 RepID=A0A9D4LJX7_DREPO|nr:hypothetical protein DPMN_101445 [Dreissena polymorpha]
MWTNRLMRWWHSWFYVTHPKGLAVGVRAERSPQASLLSYILGYVCFSYLNAILYRLSPGGPIFVQSPMYL